MVARLLRIAVALLLVGDAVALATVGTGSGPLSTAAVTARVSSAETTTAAAKTARYSMVTHVTTTIAGRPTDVTETTQGVVDFATGASEITENVNGLALDVRSVGGRIYEQLPASLRAQAHLATPWVSIPAPHLATGAASNPLPSQDPTGAFGALAGGAAGVISARDAGHATIDGVDTTHYVVSLDPAKISQATNGVFGQVLPGFSPQVTVSTLTFDVWTDAQRRVRRYQSGETLTVSIAGHTVSAQVAATGDYTDFGVPVNVVAPPASQVTAVPNLSTLIPGFGGKGSVSIQPTV